MVRVRSRPVDESRLIQNRLFMASPPTTAVLLVGFFSQKLIVIDDTDKQYQAFAFYWDYLNLVYTLASYITCRGAYFGIKIVA
jgi:hypothetical protein